MPVEWKKVQTVNDGPDMAVQSDIHRADIKHILARYRALGIRDHMAQVDLNYRDVSEFTDYADLMRSVRQAEFDFMQLPSKVREVFDHDVAKWLDAAHDKEKLDAIAPRLAQLGIFKAGEEAPPAPSSPPGGGGSTASGPEGSPPS